MGCLVVLPATYQLPSPSALLGSWLDLLGLYTYEIIWFFSHILVPSSVPLYPIILYPMVFIPNILYVEVLGV